MNFWAIAKLGAGTDADPARPDLPADVPWVGIPNGGGTYLVAVPDGTPVSSKTAAAVQTSALSAETSKRGLREADALRWFVASSGTVSIARKA